MEDIKDIEKESEGIAGIDNIYGSNSEDISEISQVMPASSTSLTQAEGIGKIDIVLIDCKRCGHKWIPRVPVVRICPSCKSPYWNVERTRVFNGNSRNNNNTGNNLNNNHNSNSKSNNSQKNNSNKKTKKRGK